MRALAIYFAIFLLLYGSFIIVEEGVTDIRGQRGDSRALSLSYEDEIIYVIFAGERYELDLIEVYSFISRFISININKIRSLHPYKNPD